MSAQEDPLSLLEELKQKYGVEESDPLHGPSVIVPNSEYKPEWTGFLSQAGIKIFLGDKYGRVAWIIPLKPRVKDPSDDLRKKSLDVDQDDPEVGSNPDESRRRGCITGRAWTVEEDSLLVEMIHQDKTAVEIAKDLAGRLDRTEDAIKGRVRKLRRRPRVGSESDETPEKPRAVTPATTEPPAFETGSRDLRSLLESALFQANCDEFTVRVAHSLDEACKLVEAGFDYVTDMEGGKIFRRRK